MSDAREALVALLWEKFGAGPNGPLAAWLTEADCARFADAILASFDVTPRGERVKPTVEVLSDALAGEGIDALPGEPDLTAMAERLLALFPGRTEAEVKAEALREAAPGCNCEDDYAWLNDRADRIEKEADRG